MQDLTYTACKNATDSGQLIDSRDGKIYHVAKLKDNNCWMTQNLDYNDPGGIRRIGDTKPDAWPNDNSMRQYWDPGEKIVSGSTLAAASSTTDTHLLVGNYYSWSSATMSSGDAASTDGQNVSGSVCPIGWQLPKSGNNVTANGSFGGLTNGISAGSTLVAAPYYFQYSGLVSSGGLGSTGGGGRYWSSTVHDNISAYNLFFGANNVGPSGNNNRYYGMPLRCLVQGS